MPTYQVIYTAEKVMSVRNFFGLTIMECIDKAIDHEKTDWAGEIISLKLAEVKQK
jgi:hypothetical protein